MKSKKRGVGIRENFLELLIGKTYGEFFITNLLWPLREDKDHELISRKDHFHEFMIVIDTSPHRW